MALQLVSFIRNTSEVLKKRQSEELNLRVWKTPRQSCVIVQEFIDLWDPLCTAPSQEVSGSIPRLAPETPALVR